MSADHGQADGRQVERVWRRTVQTVPPPDLGTVMVWTTTNGKG